MKNMVLLKTRLRNYEKFPVQWQVQWSKKSFYTIICTFLGWPLSVLLNFEKNDCYFMLYELHQPQYSGVYVTRN